MLRRSARSRLLVALLGLSLSAVACSAERPSLGDEAGASREVVADDSTTTVAPEPTPRVLRLAIGADWAGDPADAVAVGINAQADLGRWMADVLWSVEDRLARRSLRACLLCQSRPNFSTAWAISSA